MIAILHGYLLEGSGSNLWTRSIVRSLVRDGETVHLMCQENQPELYDFIAEAYRYHRNGSVETIFRRTTAYQGKCILHKPDIGDVLPVYVWDHYEEFPRVVPMIELPDDVLGQYIEWNKKALRKILQRYPVSVLHANHAVLMSVVAREISRETGRPYTIMPHGSAIEYTVKKDGRFFRWAEEAFRHAGRIFVIGREMRTRVLELFPNIADLAERLVELNLGVDTQMFVPLETSQRRATIRRLIEHLHDHPRGKSSRQTRAFLQEASSLTNAQSLTALTQMHREYPAKLPDQDVEAKLSRIDWDREPILLFVGRLIAGKGLHSILAALPEVFSRSPEARLLVVGHGPLREAMELLVYALSTGNQPLAEQIVHLGRALEGGPREPLVTIQYYWQRLKREGGWASYWQAAQRYLSLERVVFTGYLTHAELRYLFPCCDVAIFPSVVAEAGPLVFLEALSAGCFPMGTDFAGMAASIDAVSAYLPPPVVEYMKIRPDAAHTVEDIATKAPRALSEASRYKESLRKAAVERYDWRRVAGRFSRELHRLGTIRS